MAWDVLSRDVLSYIRVDPDEMPQHLSLSNRFYH